MKLELEGGYYNGEFQLFINGKNIDDVGYCLMLSEQLINNQYTSIIKERISKGGSY